MLGFAGVIASRRFFVKSAYAIFVSLLFGVSAAARYVALCVRFVVRPYPSQSFKSFARFELDMLVFDKGVVSLKFASAKFGFASLPAEGSALVLRMRVASFDIFYIFALSHAESVGFAVHAAMLLFRMAEIAFIYSLLRLKPALSEFYSLNYFER